MVQSSRVKKRPIIKFNISFNTIINKQAPYVANICFQTQLLLASPSLFKHPEVSDHCFKSRSEFPEETRSLASGVYFFSVVTYVAPTSLNDYCIRASHAQ